MAAHAFWWGFWQSLSISGFQSNSCRAFLTPVGVCKQQPHPRTDSPLCTEDKHCRLTRSAFSKPWLGLGSRQAGAVVIGTWQGVRGVASVMCLP